MDRRAERLAEDVPQRDLDRADRLRRQTLPSEVAVERDPQVGDAVTDGQRVTPLEVTGADVLDDGAEDGRIGVAPVRRGLAPTDDPRVRLDPHQGPAPLHLRVEDPVTGQHRPNVLDLHSDPSSVVAASRPWPANSLQRSSGMPSA